MMERHIRGILGFGVMATCILCVPHCAQAQKDADAAAILRETGVKGGIVAHIGCGDGRVSAALHADERYTVHGLERDADKVAAARVYLHGESVYGPVAVERLAGGSLPYADGLINLVVVEDVGAVPMDEVMRVLAPAGVACVKTASGWRQTVKPVPSTIDDWSHYLHDAGNNAVAADSVVGPPRRLQWLAPPLWLRSHETPSGIQAQVAAGGRLFYIFDEGLIGITDERLPARWSIVCRDAFNGRLLWKRPLPRWGWREWARSRLEGKDWTGIRALRTTVPAENQRRLVADAERVYVTLGYVAPVSILDAATGDIIATVNETEPTSEILVSDGVALAHVRRGADKPQSVLVAVNGDSGAVLWQNDAGGAVRALALALDAGRVFYQLGRNLVSVDLKTGERLWQTELKTKNGRTLVASSGVVLNLGGAALDSYDAASGALLWSNTIPKRSGPEALDLFVTDGVAWPGMIPVDENLEAVRKSERALAIGFDLRTGAEKKRVLVDNFRSPEHHHRCYRNKATSRYIISGMEGAEFLDLAGDNHAQNNWLRGACKEGVMPCYGLLYVPPDQCFCQPGAKLLGYTAVASGASPAAVPDSQRLERGPAYGAPLAPHAPSPQGDWPTFRHDPARSGSTMAAVPVRLTPAWHVDLGGVLTQPVYANGKLLVAATDRHTAYAFDVESGKELWRYTADGRIDSPPTLWNGLVLVGSRDGRVTCLRESDGALVWRFLAAPVDRRIGCFDQLESAWPVHGSVLVRDGVAFVAAGRSTYLDGGIRLYALEPTTGRILHKGLLEGPHPDMKRPRDVAFYIPGANADILVSEGDFVYMRQKKLTLDLREVVPEVLTSKGEADVGLHIFSTSGLLDGSWYNRAFWMYSQRWPGFQLANQAPKSGQLLVVDNEATYALKVFYRRNVHSTMFFPGKEGYLLFADANANEPQIVGEEGAREPLRWLPQSDYSRGRKGEVRALNSEAFGLDKGIGYTRAAPPLWTLWLPIRVRAMVKTRDALFAAGSPDVLDPSDPLVAFEGRAGGTLVAVSAENGSKLSETKLDSPPVFDGMSAAEGRLFVALRNGTLLCLAGPGGG